LFKNLVSAEARNSIVHHGKGPVLEFRDVTVDFGGRSAAGAPALDSVSFTIESGQSTALVGPNGAGKSTLLKVVAGTIKPGKGQVEVFGHTPEDHVCVAYVPQRNQIDWSFPVTVEEVVMMGRAGSIGLLRWPRKNDWRIVHEALARVGLTHLARRQLGELSGGEQQRVFIARALAQEAELLLLDEPFNGIDMASRDLLLEIIGQMKAQGVTVVMSTHDLHLATEHFDSVLLINHRLLASGAPEEVLSADNLVAAFSDHLHVIQSEDGAVVIADTCCDHGEVAEESVLSPR